jgi:hypothetical protein
MQVVTPTLPFQLLSDEESPQPAQRSLAVKPAQNTSSLGNSPSVEIQVSRFKRHFPFTE